MPPPPAYEATAELHVTLPGGCRAHVLFEGNVTKEAVERLCVYLQFFAEDQPSRKVMQATSASGEADPAHG